MAHQFLAQHQAHPGQMPPHQNIGQQRQVPLAQQTPMIQQNPMAPQQGPMGQQRGMQGQQPLQSSFANYDPQLALFTFEKAKGADSWEEVEAEQQHVTVQDLQNELKRFQRSKGSVKRELNSIPSPNCRRLINELVEDQNHELESKNRTLKWNIAVIDIDWKEVNRRQRQLKRVSVVLQTGPSGYADPMAIRGTAGMAQKVQPIHPNHNFPQQQNQAGHEIPQLQRNVQLPGQQQMGHMQQQAQQMRPPPPPQGHHQHGQVPPPPPHGHPQHSQVPPPPPQGHSQHGQVPPPPPPPPGMPDRPLPPPGAHPAHHPLPPPGGVNGMPRQPFQGQQPRPMPGSFPETAHRPAMRQGQPPVEILDPSFYKKQKKHNGHHEDPSSDSESDTDEWDTESGDSVPDRFRVRNVEHGEFAHIGKPKRGRSRQSSRSKKSRHNKSHSNVRSRSRSHARVDAHRRRRDSDHIERPPMGKYSPMSSKDSSPRSSKQQLPPIHIHMNTPAAEKPTRANDLARRDSFGASSPDYRGKKISTEPMSREGSWDRHSGTASMNDNSSIHTADDSVFSEPERRRSMHRSDIAEQPHKLRSRNLPHRQESFGYPHTSHIYGEVESRQRYPAANDYPPQRVPYFDDAHNPRHAPLRRSSIQTPQGNPFAVHGPPPHFGRANTFGPETHDPMYPQRYISDRPVQDSFHFDDIQDALEHIREQKRRPLHGHTRRASEFERDRVAGAYGGYDMYERRGF